MHRHSSCTLKALLTGALVGVVACGSSAHQSPSDDGGLTDAGHDGGGHTGRGDAKSKADAPARPDAPLAAETGAGDAAIDSPTPQDAGPHESFFNIGMNISGLNYYNNNAMYADITYQMSGNVSRWDVSSPDTAAAVDSTGAPTVAAWAGWTADYPSGAYTVTWDGTGSLHFASGGTLGPVSTTMSGSVQHNTATLTVVQNLTTMSSPGTLNWNQVTATPPLTNIHIMAPASLQASGGLFTQGFLDQLQPFSTLRFMDAFQTNGNLIENWSQRTWPSEGSRSGTIQGMAYEDVIALANATGKDIWLNVPAWSTDDYVCRMARLFRYGEPGDMSNSACSVTAASSAPAGAVALNSHSQVYVEYSNEVWNWGFQQTADLYCMANGAAASGHTCTATTPSSVIAQAALTNTSIPWDTNMYYRGDEMGLILAKRNHDTWKTVFGSQASQITIVFNVQSAYAAEIDPGFTFMKNAFGSVTGTIDEMAVAPYFNIENDTAMSGVGCYDCSVDAIFQDLNQVVLDAGAPLSNNSIASWLTGDLTEANKFGLPIIAYEGGEGLSGSSANLITAQFDPRMYAATQAYFQLWDSLVGKDHLFNYYSMAGGYGTFGSWGALLNLNDPGSQKWDALMPLVRPMGDANLDGVVNAKDCTILQANFGKTGEWWSEGDLNHDGTVNAADLAILNQNIQGSLCAQ